MKNVMIIGAGATGLLCSRFMSQCGIYIDLRSDSPTGINQTDDFRTRFPMVLNTYRPGIFSFFQNLATSTPTRRVVVKDVLKRGFNRSFPFPPDKKTFTELTGRINLDIYERSNDLLRNAEVYLISKFGITLYKNIYKPFLERTHGVNPSKLCVDDRFIAYAKSIQPIINEQCDERLSIMFNPSDLLSATKVDYIQKKFRNKITEKDIVSEDRWIVNTSRIDEFFDYRFGELDYTYCRFEKGAGDVEFDGEESLQDFYNLGKDFDVRNVDLIKAIDAYDLDYVDPRYRVISELSSENNGILYKTYISCNKDTLNFLYTTSSHKQLIVSKCPDAIPCYPVRTQRNIDLYNKYLKYSASKYPKMIFCGRLGSYQNINLEECYNQAKAIAEFINDKL